MKDSILSLRSLCVASVIASLFGGINSQADFLYYGINNGSGGPGTWQNGNTSTLWYDYNSGTPNNPWNNSLQETAYFGNGGSGTITVSGNVSTNYMEFNGSGDYTVVGASDPGSSDPSVIGADTVDTITKNANTSQGYGLVLQNDTNNNVTINANLLLDTAGNTDRFNISNNGSGTVTINGNITYINSGGNTGNRSLIFNGAAGSTFIMNGTFSLGTSGNMGSLRFSEGSSDHTTLYLNGDYSGLNTGGFLDLPQGTVYLGTSKTGTGNVTAYNGGSAVTDIHTLETVGSQTIDNNINDEVRDDNAQKAGLMTVGVSDSSTSSFTGTITMNGASLNLAAVGTGGVANFSTINGDTGAGSFSTSGSGTVVLNAANSYNLYNFYTNTNNAVAADLESAKTIIKNTTGSAFGNNTGTVTLGSGKALAGTGISTQQIVATDATSIINPGLGVVGQTLTLSGGISATNGLTMNFTIDGAGNASTADLQQGNFTLGGAVTVNFTSVDGTVLTTYPNGSVGYTLAFGQGTWTEAPGTTFTFNAPAGYIVSSYNFGPEQGMNELSVEFSAAPEPSTYALLAGGLVLLGVTLRRNRTGASSWN